MQINWGWITPDKLVALATIVYALVTVVMFCVIRSQAKAAHRSLKQQPQPRNRVPTPSLTVSALG